MISSLDGHSTLLDQMVKEQRVLPWDDNDDDDNEDDDNDDETIGGRPLL